MKVEEMRGYRSPTEAESSSVSKWFKKYYGTRNKLALVGGILLCFFGLMVICTNPFNRWASIIVGLGMMYLGLRSFISRMKTTARVKQYENREFQVLDGIISKVEGGGKIQGFLTVHFCSDAGEEAGIYNVNVETVSEGLPAILVYLPSDTKKYASSFVFTQWMLTDEGIKQHP